MTEAAFQSQVIRLAHLHRWRVAHFRASPTRAGGYATAVAADGKGFPDLVLARRGVVMFRELKTRTGKPTPEQTEWGNTLGDAWAIWRPDQLETDILEQLRNGPA